MKWYQIRENTLWVVGVAAPVIGGCFFAYDRWLAPRDQQDRTLVGRTAERISNSSLPFRTDDAPNSPESQDRKTISAPSADEVYHNEITEISNPPNLSVRILDARVAKRGDNYWLRFDAVFTGDLHGSDRIRFIHESPFKGLDLGIIIFPLPACPVHDIRPLDGDASIIRRSGSTDYLLKNSSIRFQVVAKCSTNPEDMGVDFVFRIPTENDGYIQTRLHGSSRAVQEVEPEPESGDILGYLTPDYPPF
jgi:hypothetical protein